MHDEGRGRGRGCLLWDGAEWREWEGEEGTGHVGQWKQDREERLGTRKAWDEMNSRNETEQKDWDGQEGTEVIGESE